MNGPNEATPGVCYRAEGQELNSVYPKSTPTLRGRSRRAAPSLRHLGTVVAATSSLSAAALRLVHPATLRCLESVPPGAWLCDWFIDQKAKRLVRAMRRGRVHEVRNGIRASFNLPVESEDLRRYCNDLAARYWRAFL